MRKPVFRVSDRVQHKVDCTTTEDDQRLEISDIGRSDFTIYLCSENKGADQLTCTFVFAFAKWSSYDAALFIQVYLIIKLSLGSIETEHVISETVL